MNRTVNDIVLADSAQFEAILADLEDTKAFETIKDVGISIDDLVIIIGAHRSIIEHRDAFRKMRREVYGRFAVHEIISERTLALIPQHIRDEIVGFGEQTVTKVASQWCIHPDGICEVDSIATSRLTLLVNACRQAKDKSLSVFLRTPVPMNSFEMAFRKLDEKPAARFRLAFESWNVATKYEAHQRFNYFKNQGVTDCLKQVLKEFTPVKSKINLKSDQSIIFKYVRKRVKEYCKSPSPESGNAPDPVTMLALLFDLEYEGSVHFIFSTLPNASSDPFLVEHAESFVDMSHWQAGCEKLTCDEMPINLVLLDGTATKIDPASGAVLYETLVGNMLRDAMISMNDEGDFSKLKLALKCDVLVAGPHVDYFWHDEVKKTERG